MRLGLCVVALFLSWMHLAAGSRGIKGKRQRRISAEGSQACAKGCELCSEVNGCLKCSPKLFILLERNDIHVARVQIEHSEYFSQLLHQGGENIYTCLQGPLPQHVEGLVTAHQQVLTVLVVCWERAGAPEREGCAASGGALRRRLEGAPPPETSCLLEHTKAQVRRGVSLLRGQMGNPNSGCRVDEQSPQDCGGSWDLRSSHPPVSPTGVKFGTGGGEALGGQKRRKGGQGRRENANRNLSRKESKEAGAGSRRHKGQQQPQHQGTAGPVTPAGLT
ncbi:R-spondin-1 [Puma concolor]|uniref:R-spondin-1 n=1 Tax=Puma concolor TaxID=9696 RepID=A0A6P6I223_PUMCO|nr:R-spondin-1 [Puma concolor]